MPSAFAMRSDQIIQAGPLVKLRCACCGLVREGHAHVDLESMYRDEYAVAPSDYMFYTDSGPRRRSEVFTRWMIEAFGAGKWSGGRRILEVGAGAGAMLAAFSREFPSCRFEGLELCQSAAQAARAAGLPVHATPVEEWNAEPYDAIYAIGVLEHVPSPTAFLTHLRTLLKSQGYLFLAQPTQDVGSYDILFNDHLHHFGTDHLRQYARKTGFREIGFIVGHDLMPNFSLHCWQATTAEPDWSWHGAAGFSTVVDSFAELSDSFASLDSTLEGWNRTGRSIGVFGLNEVFSIARTYTQLSSVPITCGLDDDPGKEKYRGLGFPIVIPEHARQQEIDAVVLATNRIWVPRVKSRLHAMGLETCTVLA
jgi:SAM-dependent methyltransferase